MGTNYYAIIDCCDKCGRGDRKIHIGKSSAGWPFHIQTSTELEVSNWGEWYDYLFNNDVVIKDEYERELMLPEMENIVEYKRKHKADKHVLDNYIENPDFVYEDVKTGDMISSGDFS